MQAELHTLRALTLASCALVPTALATPSAPQDSTDLTVLKVGETGSGSFNYWGEDTGVRAYSMSATSCNEGTLPVPFGADTVHVGQNMFRYHEGRLEQLGFSWVHQDWCAINELGCGTCQATSCSTLGVGCASTTSGGVNEGSTGYGKHDLDPTTANFIQPTTAPTGNLPIKGRLQVPTAAMGLPGARYLMELQYLCGEDHFDGNARNSVAWREVNTSAANGNVNGSGHVIRRYECGLEAWAEFDPSVTIVELANDLEPTALGAALGHYVLGYNATSLGEGLWRYEYALQNINSDQAVSSFSIPIACGVQLSDIYFHDVDGHSGSPWSSTDWSASQAGGLMTWESTETHAQSPDANAIRWGELYNFGFTANAAPTSSNAIMGMFKPGPRSAMTTGVDGPCGTPTCGTSSYCLAGANSVSTMGAKISSSGSTSVGANDLSLCVSDGVPGQFGLFFYGPSQAMNVFGDGFLCVSSGFFRLNPPIAASVQGGYARVLDLAAAPMNAGAGAITPGSTWNFQLWYRDPVGGGAGFNLSDGLSTTWCP
ncbi:MAG: hypothetical protein ACI841_002242 [Planctomycetota bacterium]|jgi:hypothetical protein